MGGGDVRVFMLAVLPAHPAQNPFIANNIAVQCGGGIPCQNVPRFLPILMGQGEQVRVIAHLNLCGDPRGHRLGRGFLIPTNAAVASALVGTPTSWPSSCDEVGQ